MSVMPRSTQLIEPYGGQLVDLLVAGADLAEQKAYAATLPSIQLSERAVCDFELLVTGAFSPLDRFMGQADYRSVLETMRLADGRLFPIPVTLPVDAEAGLAGSEIALRNAKNDLLAIMAVEEVYEWDPAEEAQAVLGSSDARHPLVAEMQRWGRYYISGPIRALQLPGHNDFAELRLTPAQTRTALAERGREQVVGFQPAALPDRAHEELTKAALEQLDGVLLLQPAAGPARTGDVDYYTRVRTYRALAQNYYQPERIVLALLPLATRMAGPREALWHAVIRRNYGANHLIVGREYAEPAGGGRPFWPADAARELLSRYADELGVAPVELDEFVYLPDDDRYEQSGKVAQGISVARLSDREVREQYLNRGELLPPWYARPEVAQILADSYPPRHRQGVCIWFTGLSGSGKSTTAGVLLTLLLEHGRRATELDGDVVRTHLSKGLGFGKQDRDINIRRIGYVASEIVRHGGVVICAAVSPYRSTRNDVRNMVGTDNFVEVFVDTPLEVCEQRDIKGMYAKARRGEIRDFTGIDDPYEAPEHPELVLRTTGTTPEQNARRIVEYLAERGFVI